MHRRRHSRCPSAIDEPTSTIAEMSKAQYYCASSVDAYIAEGDDTIEGLLKQEGRLRRARSIRSRVPASATEDTSESGYALVLRRVKGMPDSTRRRRWPRLDHLVAMLLVLVALVSSACTSSRSLRPGTTAASPEVTELRSVSDLHKRFNRDSGKIRLILLVSPT